MLDQRQGLYKLANVLDWTKFDEAFEGLYSERGRPGLPIRRMVGLLLLKQVMNLSDERVCELWQQNPYMQYFCGEKHFQWALPCDPSELVYFRGRIGREGMETILKATVELHRDKVEKETEVVADTTVQEADVTYPTDVKLRRKIIEKMWKMGEEEGVKWDHSYTRTVPKILAILRTRSNSMVKARRKAKKKLKTIAGRLIREFERKASPAVELLRREELELFKKVLAQKRTDTDKIYSLHDPTVRCIAKGKAHKKYEFGRKASVVMLRDSGVIVGATSFEDNLYDGDTLYESLWQVSRVTGSFPESCLVDRGYKGRARVEDTEIVHPKTLPKSLTGRRRKEERKRRARRSAIEPVIGHLKSDFRMARCFLHGAKGAENNLLMAAAAWNLRKWILFVPIFLRNRLLVETLIHRLYRESVQRLRPSIGTAAA